MHHRVGSTCFAFSFGCRSLSRVKGPSDGVPGGFETGYVAARGPCPRDVRPYFPGLLNGGPRAEPGACGDGRMIPTHVRDQPQACAIASVYVVSVSLTPSTSTSYSLNCIVGGSTRRRSSNDRPERLRPGLMTESGTQLAAPLRRREGLDIANIAGQGLRQIAYFIALRRGSALSCGLVYVTAGTGDWLGFDDINDASSLGIPAETGSGRALAKNSLVTPDVSAT